MQLKKLFFVVSVIGCLLLGSSAFAAYIDNGDGTVTDNGTGLMWQKATAPGHYRSFEARGYCNNLELAGYTDWRLPTVEELESLVDTSRVNPSINITYFPDTISSFYCSSTYHEDFIHEVWFVDFYSGGLAANMKSLDIHVRAVRAGLCSGLCNLVIAKSGMGFGLGTGTVASRDGKINCGSDCSATYTQDTLVTLTAKASSGSVFRGWLDGGCSGRADCTITFHGNVTVTAAFAIDTDGDSMPDAIDNCPSTCNPQQLDADHDFRGDVCDTTPGCGGVGQPACEQSQSCDADNDGFLNAADNCPNVYNPLQLDADGDSIGDVCDPSPSCGTGCGQPVCEGQVDTDGDGWADAVDNCPNSCNAHQRDADGDGIGDVCDPDPGCGGEGQPVCEQSCDTDNDGILNALDNCPNVYNPQQLDANKNGTGDCCDPTPGCGGCGQPECEVVCTHP
jgi:hypothetical protein